ncbi:MAG: lamin tail domain-containing protein [Myxococcales bacterium]|nr:lamin tail domain-containing protein [Myxococcales bacterium]MBP6847065.1 lamin tail domain-containing protein [Kofleriaceae bacterium]
MHRGRLAVLGLVVAALGCGDDGAPPPPPPAVGLCAAKTLAPWARAERGVGGAVTLNEVMYHPGPASPGEWIELYNPLAIDVDLSGARLAGAIAYTFPDGARVGPRGFVVVADGPGVPGAIGVFTGRLPDDGGAIELWNANGRLLDAVRYGDVAPWPIPPDGAGPSLAKRAAESASEPPEAWTASARLGGTPGAVNAPASELAQTVQTLVPLGATWRYQAASAAPPGWAAPGFDDAAWPAAPAAFFASATPPPPVTATARFTADNFVALYVGKADGADLRPIGRDAIGDWTSPETWTFTAGADDHLFVAAWEAPGDDGGPQMVIGQVALPDGTLVATDTGSFEWALGPPGAAPGGALTDPAPAPALVQSVIAGATWAAPLAAADNGSAPWGGALSGQFAPSARYLWPDTFASASETNTRTTFALFRSRRPLIPPRGATAVPPGAITTYYRTHFQIAAGLTLEPWLDLRIDDGAIVYVNGVEVARVRMPAGAAGATTLASSAVTDATLEVGRAIAASALASGDNLLAVEVHQATSGDPDLAFDAALRASVIAAAPEGPPPGVALNEVAGASATEFWIELTNRGAAPVDLAGVVVASSAGPEHALAARTLAPGEVMLVTQAELGFGATVGDKLFLYRADRAAVLDGLDVVAVPRGRAATHDDWRYPDVATPGAANVFVTHDELVINELMYHPPPAAQPDGSLARDPLEWIELYNRSAAPVDVGGYQLVDAVAYQLPAGTVVPAGGYLLISNDAAALTAAEPGLPAPVVGDYAGSLADGGDHLVLRDACGNPVDQVRYHDGGAWPAAADGGGASLELRDLRADHDAGAAWAASDESARGGWQTISYQQVATPSAVGPDGAWQELVIGLLDAGEVLIDDVSVVVDPAGAATELIADGAFEAGAAGFRLLGNHRHGEVIDDPTAPGNHVLRLVATGPTEHMHNHVETTLGGGHVITNGRTYRISLRARWRSGSNLLNTRLYFDRLARTTTLAVPGRRGTPGARNSAAIDDLGPTYRELRHTPAVPRPGQPVTVTVTAADPDGVAGLTLWTAIDGGAPTRQAMTATGGGGFAATVPGAAAGTVVQFWVDGADAAGATAMAPAAGPASRALWKVDDGLAATSGLHNLRVIVPPADAAWLFEPANLMSNDPIGATVVSDEREVTYDVGLRLKSSERGRPEVVRVGFALRFPPEQPFRGIHPSVMIDRSQGVGFGQRELLFNQAMNRAGSVHAQYDDLIQVLPPRREHTGPAQLQLARYGDLLLDFQFDRGGDGALFEYELVYYPLTTDDGTPTGRKLPQPDAVVGTALRDLGPDEEAYRQCFIAKNNRWRDDYRGLIRALQAWSLPSPQFEQELDRVIDVDEWLRATAFATLSGAIDNYASGAQHNADFFVRPSDGRLLYFPHDLDFLGSPQGPVVGNGDLARLVAQPAWARLYYGHLNDIITTAFNATYLAPWSSQLGGLLPGQDFAGHLQYVAARADWVMRGAPDAVTRAIPPIAFQITTNGGAAFAVAAPSATLDGAGWVDVAAIHRAGAPLTATWPSRTGWRVTTPLACGANLLALEARDRRGRPVGADTVTVTRTGAGCP